MISRTSRATAAIARRLVAGRLLRQFILAGAGLVLLAATGGCASITNGTSQSINVNSDPGEADCTLTRDGRELATIKTPAPVKVKRESRTIHVLCRKEGFRDGETTMDARFETATLGNLILGGVVGLAVDAASGAYQRYDGFVMVHLTPLPPTAAATQPAPAPATSALPAAAASSRPVASTAGEGSAPAPIAPGSGLSRSRL
jgi:hypothetical protein